MDDHSDRSSPLNIPATGFIGKWLLATLLDADEGLGLDCRITVLNRDPGTFLRCWPVLAVRRQQASLDQFRSRLCPLPPGMTQVPETHRGGPDPRLPSSAYGEGKRVSEWLVSRS